MGGAAARSGTLLDPHPMELTLAAMPFTCAA